MESGFSDIIVANVGQSSGADARGSDAHSRQLDLVAIEAVLSEHGVRDGLEQLARIISQVNDLYSMGWFSTDVAGNLTSECRFAHHLPLAEDGLEQLLGALAQRCAELEPVQCGTASFEREITRADMRGHGEVTQETCLAVAARVVNIRGESGILAAAVDHRRSSPGQLSLLFSVITNTIRIVTLGEELLESRQETGASAAVVDLAARIESCSTQAEACQQLVNEAKRHTGSELVAIGVVPERGRLCRLEATTCSGTLDDDQTQCLEAALNEVLIRETLTLFPNESQMDRHGQLAVQQVAASFEAGSVTATPIHDADGIPVAVWLCLGPADAGVEPANTRFIRAASLRLGTSLDLVRRAEQPAWRQVLNRHFAKARRSPARTTALCLLLAVDLFVLPVDFRVKCRCELQPVVRRFVAAPFDGTLEECFVESGQAVTEGELLARFDDREINWEMAGIDAERQRVSTERDGHLVKQDIGAAEISRYDLERLALRQRLLTHRSENLEIRSPIDGLVVSGDLKKSVGVPLSSGDRMFEIAPLDRILVEVAIPEADIRHTAVDQQVEVWLDAFPRDSWTGQVKRIHPRSEIREKEHVFIAEIELENERDRLRPGMRGTARVSTGLRPAGWILLHRPWEALLMKLGW
jgi:hypothetical protein